MGTKLIKLADSVRPKCYPRRNIVENLTIENSSTDSLIEGVDGFVLVGESYDVLYQIPYNENLVKPDEPPQGGWKWRPCIVKKIKNARSSTTIRRVTVEFLDNLEDYLEKATIEHGDLDEIFEDINTQSHPNAYHHSYEKGALLDVLEYFEGVETWRQCEVVTVQPYFIKVHFFGLDSLRDIWIHVLQESQRMALLGTRTGGKVAFNPFFDRNSFRSFRKRLNLENKEEPESKKKIPS